MKNKSNIDIVIFAGGRGNKNLFFEMKKRMKKINQLSVIINGLDDGASTGEIRRLFHYKAHGISDFLKAILSLSPNQKLINAMEARFPMVNSFEERLLLYRNLHKMLYKNFLPKYFSSLSELPEKTKKTIIKKFIIFFDYFYQNRDEIIDIEDFKIGNILFGAMLVENHLDFNKAINSFSKFCNLNKNIRIYENTNSVRYLSGLLKNGTLLPNEASVVLTRTTDSIKDIYQMTNPITMNQIRKLSSIEIDDKIDFLKSLRNIPTYNQDIKEKILNGDIIVYGSGTPYSSILPSLETKGIADLIIKNKAPKVMIANLKKETNNFLSVSDLVNDLYKYLNRSTSKRLNKKDLLTHLIVNDSTYEESNSITLDEEKILNQCPWLTIIKGNFSDPLNSYAHNGKNVLKALLKIANNN
ncbi:MAG: hypothetical protein CMG62_00205 [Candidatus Marinimicrobia bacterium]|nr:hypothetical protein [Candidatus Neomarinimicrobiota bacterium]